MRLFLQMGKQGDFIKNLKIGKKVKRILHVSSTMTSSGTKCLAQPPCAARCTFQFATYDFHRRISFSNFSILTSDSETRLNFIPSKSWAQVLQKIFSLREFWHLENFHPFCMEMFMLLPPTPDGDFEPVWWNPQEDWVISLMEALMFATKT